MTGSATGAPVRLVLVRPRDPQNLGAVARAMKNFALGDWAAVSLATHDFATARRVAVHAGDLLDRPRLCATLDEAVADCAWVVATSSRVRRGAACLAPAAVADEVVRRAPARTAIVFGDERSGLTAEEVRRCHDVSEIPTDAAQPSLNLAQAVVVYAYAVRCSWLGRAERVPGPRAAAASDAALLEVERTLRGLLAGGGFLAAAGRGAERHAVRDLMDTLRRGRLTAREARLWIAALRRVARSLR